MRVSSLVNGNLSLRLAEDQRLERTAKFEVVEVSEFTSRVPVAILRTELCAEMVHAPRKAADLSIRERCIGLSACPSSFLPRKTLGNFSGHLISDAWST